MFTMRYYASTKCVGCLAFRGTLEQAMRGELGQCLGGVDPGNYPGDRAIPTTVISTEDTDTVCVGWLHPGDLGTASITVVSDLDAARLVLVGQS